MISVIDGVVAGGDADDFAGSVDDDGVCTAGDADVVVDDVTALDVDDAGVVVGDVAGDVVDEAVDDVVADTSSITTFTVALMIKLPLLSGTPLLARHSYGPPESDWAVKRYVDAPKLLSV